MEKRNSVDQQRYAAEQRRRAALRFIDEHRAILACQGSLVATWRQRAATRTGPYFLLVVRDAQGRRPSVYLGVASPLVEEVRGQLARLQSPLRERRISCRVQRQLRRELRHARQELDRNLAPTELRRKGSEIRGWRSRRTAPTSLEKVLISASVLSANLCDLRGKQYPEIEPRRTQRGRREKRGRETFRRVPRALWTHFQETAEFKAAPTKPAAHAAFRAVFCPTDW